MAISDSEVFCMMPWVHLHVTQNGHVTPCCLAPWYAGTAFGSVNQESISEIWNGERMREFRSNMLAGKPSELCKACYQNEANGFRSLRQETNEAYAHRAEWIKQTEADGTVANQPVYLDIRFSNVCNFKCRICGPGSSSQWHEEAVALGWKKEGSKALHYSIDDPMEFRNQIEKLIPDLEEVYFAGGEPMVMEEHYHFLDLLIKHGKFDLTLRYNTNFSGFQFRDKNILEIWRPFRQVQLQLSLDGMGKRAEFMRKNQVWKGVEQQWENLKALANLSFVITPTVSVFNVFHLPDFHNHLIGNGTIPAEDFQLNILNYPEVYDIRNLPSDMKQACVEKIESHMESLNGAAMSRQWEAVLNRLRQERSEKLWQGFLEATNKLDKLRDESFLDVFPEFSI